MKKLEVRRLGGAEERIMRNDSAVLFLCRPIFRCYPPLPDLAAGHSLCRLLISLERQSRSPVRSSAQGAQAGGGPGRVMLDSIPFLQAQSRQFIRQYYKSDVIFEEGTHGAEMYIICSWHIRLVTLSPFREVELATIGPFQFFGEISLVDSSPRSTTAIAEKRDPACGPRPGEIPLPGEPAAGLCADLHARSLPPHP